MSANSANNPISFLPDDYLERKAQRRASMICGVLFIMVMGGLGSAFWLQERTTRDLDVEVARIDDQYIHEAQRIQQVAEMQEKQKRMARQADITSSLLERVPRSVLLAEYTNLLPPGASLLDVVLDSKVILGAQTVDQAKTAFEQKKAAKQAPANPTFAEPKRYEVGIKLTGIAGNDTQVALYLQKLSQSKLFKDVNLVVTEEYMLEKQPLRKFQMEMVIDPTVDVQQLAGVGMEKNSTSVTPVGQADTKLEAKTPAGSGNRTNSGAAGSVGTVGTVGGDK